MTRFSARGTRLQVGDGGSEESFTTIAQVINIVPGEIGADHEDATDHDSPKFVEQIVATIIRTGELTFEVHHDPSEPTHDQATGLIKIAQDGEIRNFRVVYLPDTDNQQIFQFPGLLRYQPPQAPIGGKLVSSGTIKLAGLFTFPQEEEEGE